MKPSEYLELAHKQIEFNEHHGVIPARLARDIVNDVAREIMEYARQVIGRPLEK